MKLFLMFFSSVMIVFPYQSRAAKVAATLVFVKGEVKILRNRKSVKGGARTLLYEGKPYAYTRAKIGTKLRPRDIVHSGPNGKAKLVYANGDHLAIGHGSSVQIPGDIEREKDNSPTLNIFYGKIRALISKKGPRKNLKIRTKSAVAGVRGTDFFIKDTGVKGTNVTVLRGAVSLALSEKKNRSKVLRETTVNAGYSANVKGDFAKNVGGLPKKVPEIEVYEAPKNQLLEIQKASQMKAPGEKTEMSKDVEREVADLEKKAAKAVLLDIKLEDEKLYQKLKSEKIDSAEELNTAVLSKLYKIAPKAKTSTKPTEDEVKDLGGDEIYNKYFKND